MSDPRHPFAARLGRWPAERLAVILRKRVQRMLRYFPAQLEMDMAHTVMLAERGVLGRGDAGQILAVLTAIRDAGPEGLHIGTEARSTLFWYVEARLIAELGEELGGRMHTGRSHNDILPTVSRMTARADLYELMRVVIELERALVTCAGLHTETIMPGYTSLQHAQPWTLGHYLSGWAYALGRDFGRLRAAYETTDQSPLGASALAGSSWPLDRERTASLLGFRRVLTHSRDAGFGTKDYVLEILAATSILMSNVGVLASDLYLWSTYEFGMIEIDDAYCGTSSMMPQKKNAWAVDWARGAAGNAIGHLASSLGAMKGASSTDGAAQDYPETPLEEALDTASDYVDLLAGVIESMRVKADVMFERANANWTTASNLADAIVRHASVSFRAAHSVVGRFIRDALAAGVTPQSANAAMVDQAAIATIGRAVRLDDAQVRAALDPAAFIRTRITTGSVHPDHVRAMLGELEGAVQDQRAWLDARGATIAAGRAELERSVAELLTPAGEINKEFR